MALTYRVWTTRLRVQRGPGNPDLVVERPQNPAKTMFLDSDEAPTLVTFDEQCQVDIPMLLRIGAITEHVPAAEPDMAPTAEEGRAPDTGEEVSDG